MLIKFKNPVTNNVEYELIVFKIKTTAGCAGSRVCVGEGLGCAGAVLLAQCPGRPRWPAPQSSYIAQIAVIILPKFSEMIRNHFCNNKKIPQNAPVVRKHWHGGQRERQGPGHR